MQKKRRRKTPKSREKELKIIPLGGLGEIGKNMMLIEYDQDILIVDSGLMFPEEEMLGIDFVIPDISYVIENKQKVRGVVLTHGHEDHIGSLPFLLPHIPDVPIYGTKLTLAIVGIKMAEMAPNLKPQIIEIAAGDSVEMGPFKVEFVSVCHSVPDGVGLCIDTPAGKIVHTGDFKLDPTPVDGRMTDYHRFAQFGEDGVLLLLSDSTNVEKGGFTLSERTVSQSLETTFRLNRAKRIVVAAFASNIHRLQQVIDTAIRFNRKVALVGRSMLSIAELAQRLGYLNVPEDVIVPVSYVDRMPLNKLVIMTTGSQGEPFSGLVLMSKGDHKYIKITDKDLVIISASVIPGNEKLISKTINRLFEKGAEVVYESERMMHVSGHAAREELKMMLSLVRPKYFVPVHGEYRHLVRHAQLAQEMGISSNRVFVLKNGEMLHLSKLKAEREGFVSSGQVLVDGLHIGEAGSHMIRERQQMAEDGILVVSIVMDSEGMLSTRPVIECRGLPGMSYDDPLSDEISCAIEKVVEKWTPVDEDMDMLGSRIKSRVKEVLNRKLKVYPIIIPIITMTPALRS